MKKSQAFTLLGLLLAWGAPLGALFLKYLAQGMPSDLVLFVDTEWARNPFWYWYMLIATSLVLMTVGYFLGKNEDRADLWSLRLLDEALHDPLTGLTNHRHMHEILSTQFKRHLDTHRPISCLMLDLDLFKRVNDTYGHPFGDRVLRIFAQLLRGNIRQGDIAARYGGEEFLCIMPDCGERDARMVADRIRSETERLVFPENGQGVRITVSIGSVTVHGTEKLDYRFLIEESDRNLYQAKAKGRNCTVGTVV